MEYNEEIQEQDLLEESESGSMKQWFQDNLRIIISALVVVVIAAGIYSYSSRTENSNTPEEKGGLLSEITEEEKTASQDKPEDKNVSQDKQVTEDKKVDQGDQKVSPATSSQETENSFIETAGRGDGTTKLARHALANYLEKNPDSSLKAEHKIYIEDYMRKHVPQKKVRIGSSVEFQKSLIEKAISQSKNLNERQLQNLHKYAVKVPSLT
jgi:hypothetical protein